MFSKYEFVDKSYPTAQFFCENCFGKLFGIRKFKNNINDSLYQILYIFYRDMDKKKIAPITDNLNKALDKALQNFSSNTQWTDINNWLLSLQAILNDNPSPFINQKILLAKRLSQCTNPILPDKVQECVLKIHQSIFYNMRAFVDNNINEYVRLFAEDLGVYSLSILSYFTHTSASIHRILILNLLNEYYLDLGMELVPMLSGIIKALLPVYSMTTQQGLQKQIQKIIMKLIAKTGRRYTIAIIWSSILKFTDCRAAGVKLLGKFIKKMQFIKDEEDYASSHGFSEEQREVMMELLNQKQQQHTSQMIIPEIIPKQKQSGQQGQNQNQNQNNGFGFIHANSFSENNTNLAKIREQQHQDDSEDRRVSSERHNQMTNSQSDLGMLLMRTGRQKPKQPGNIKLSLQSPHPIKLNKVPLMVTPGIELIKQGIDQETDQNNYPNHNTLVISALIACLQDQSQFIKRSCLDFMFSHLRLKSEVLDDDDKRLLVQAVLRLFRKKQISITKRVNRWLFGKQDQQNRFVITQKNQAVVPFLIESLKKIFQIQPKNQQTSITPLKIIQNFYMDHSNLIQYTIHQITLPILRYIFNYSSNYEFSESVLKAGKRFFENILSYYPAILRSLGKMFVEGVKSGNDNLAFQSIKYIDYCYIKLMHHQHDISELDYITVSLDFLSQGLKCFAIQNNASNSHYYKVYLKDTNLLVYNLLNRRKSVQKFMRKQQQKLDQKYIDETGQKQIPVERKQYQDELKNQQSQQKQTYTQILNKLQYFFIGLGTVIKATTHLQIYQDIYKLSAMAMVLIQIHLPQNFQLPQNQLPKWFITIEYGIRVASPSISLSAIESMIKCLMYENNHPVYAQFKTRIMYDKNSKHGNDYQHLALQKLWALLDYPHMHNKIIDLIVAFSKFFPYQFTETVKKSFQAHSDAEKQASIQRFSHFWRLTGFKFKQLLLSNREFSQLNKVGLFKMLDFLDDKNPLVRHAARNWMMDSLPLFHRVLQPLFFQLMKVCGDWYRTPKGLLIIKNLYDTSAIFNTFRRIRSLISNGSYSFLRFIYQKQLPDTLSDLRQKVTNISDSILAPQNISNLFESKISTEYQKEPVLPKSLEAPINYESDNSFKNTQKITYIDMLIILSIKYIEGHAIESMGINFYKGNAGVNTSAIQLLESLLNYLDNPELCRRMVSYIMQPLSKILWQCVANHQYITQIQLLSIFRTIFFNSSFRKKGQIQQIRNFFKIQVFRQKNFLGSLLKGLNTPLAYVRAQFINFITSCIPLIADFLEPQQCTECIKHILFTYYRIIKEIKFHLIQEVLQQQEDSLQTLNEAERKSSAQKTIGLTRMIEYQIKAKQEQKFINLSGSLQQVAKTNQVLSILHGVSAILNYFYDFDKMNISEMQFQFSNPYTFFDTFKSLITLGLASSEKTGKLIENTEFLHNMQTCQSILKQMSPVYQTILRAWPLSEQFVRIATQEFTSIGSREFNFQKFSKYNKTLVQLISFVTKQKQSIWGKIFSILQPMFFKFPREITQIYLNLWIKQCTNVGGYEIDEEIPLQQKLKIKPKMKNTQFLMKIVQTIVVSNFPMNITIHAFLQTQTLDEIKLFYENKKKQKSIQTLSYYICQIEAKLLYFLYIYFMYVHIQQKNLNKENLIDIWSIILKSLKPFLQSRNPSTAIWILDILNMCATKYSPKQILINEKFKSDLHGIVNQSLKYIANIAAKKQPVFYEDPTKIGLQSSKDWSNQRFRIVLPLPPSLFEIYKRKDKERNQIDSKLFDPIKAGDIIALEMINRLWCFKVLKKLGFEIIQNVYLSQKMHFGVIRACQWMQIILSVIQDKSKQNMIFAQSSSQVLHNLLENARIIFIKPLKNSILKIFNKDDFFICNKVTLKYWAQIIDWIVSSDKNNETFSEYLSKVSLSNSYFTNQNQQNKRRIKSFERICFILYSGQKDKYAMKIKGLLQKIADVIKIAESAHPALLILVLFSIRILILKLSQISLNQLFIDIWPMILAFMMQIFSKKLVKVQIANQISRNPNLLLASLKLVQMISISNLSQFAHHQWVFIYDYFGVDLSLIENSQEMNQILLQRPQLNSLVSYTKNVLQSPFYFKPYIFNYMPQHSISYVPKGPNKQAKQNQIKYTPKKRQIIVKNSFVRSEDEVKCYIFLMSQYLVQTNQFRMSIDENQIEQVIITDFIMLDSFIHKI